MSLALFDQLLPYFYARVTVSFRYGEGGRRQTSAHSALTDRLGSAERSNKGQASPTGAKSEGNTDCYGSSAKRAKES
jgi:hypothetical protein